jgi:peptidoglycan L-alanyl-D-glutamate endopeptidase CwlK
MKRTNRNFDPSELSASGEGFFDVPLREEMLNRDDDVTYGLRFNFGSLDSEFAKKLNELLGACAAENVIMVPYTGVRDPWEQARLWRRSRTTQQVADAIQWLKNNMAPFLAKVVEDVGPQPTGPKVTNALPGFSWHQWGEAADCYWSVNGEPEWEDLTGYKAYARLAEGMGLTAGGHWTSFKDWPHVQKRSDDGPGSVYSAKEIDEIMKKRFETKKAFLLTSEVR